LDSQLLTELLALARGGDEKALGRLLETFRPYLLAIANRELGAELRGKGGASDLVQETFAEAVRGLGDFRGQSEGELVAWLRQVLLHNVANFSRQFNVAAKRQVAREVSLDNSSRRELKNGLASALPSPSDRALRDEDVRRLRAALERLPSPYREVIVWRNLERLAFAEIGRRLGRTEKAAQKLWSRAIRALQQSLEMAP
jgi:RNA polymerase sigma-70 factor (ECF subfamily)